jgi:hypothetical protein
MNINNFLNSGKCWDSRTTQDLYLRDKVGAPKNQNTNYLQNKHAKNYYYSSASFVLHVDQDKEGGLSFSTIWTLRHLVVIFTLSHFVVGGASVPNEMVHDWFQLSTSDSNEVIYFSYQTLYFQLTTYIHTSNPGSCGKSTLDSYSRTASNYSRKCFTSQSVHL